MTICRPCRKGHHDHCKQWVRITHRMFGFNLLARCECNHKEKK